MAHFALHKSVGLHDSDVNKIHTPKFNLYQSLLTEFVFYLGSIWLISLRTSIGLHDSSRNKIYTSKFNNCTLSLVCNIVFVIKLVSLVKSIGLHESDGSKIRKNCYGK